jgi:hypothetical protein
MNTFDDFNIRQLQAYAAISLSLLCKKFNIRHQQIDDLIFHLLTMLTADNLSEWERNGTNLSVSGRGDELPMDVEKSIKGIDVTSFREIIESCVEIGIVDMYGADTEQPRFFFDRCITQIENQGVDLPSPELIEKLHAGRPPWGDPISATMLDELIKGTVSQLLP